MISLKTATKNCFTNEQIKELIGKHFPESELETITSLSGGTFNTLYEIKGSGELSNGVILKTGPNESIVVPSHEQSILQTEVYAYIMLADKELPVPQIYAYDFSKEDIPCDYFIMKKIEGKTWFDYWPIKDSRLMRELGRYTAALHSVDKKWFGYMRWDKTGRFDKWGEAFIFMIDEVLNSAEHHGMKLPFKKIQNIIEERREMLNELKSPSLVNFDMWAGNIFVKKEPHYSISGFIDFERSFMGDPLASFSSALLLYNNVEKEKEFLAGYNEVSREPLVITDADREKMVMYELLMYLRAYSEIHRYGFWFGLVQRVVIRLIITELMSKLKRFKKKRLKKSEHKRQEVSEVKSQRKAV